jgi:hypothetical protein
MIMENTKNIIDIFLMLIFTAHIFIAQKIIAQNVGKFLIDSNNYTRN